MRISALQLLLLLGFLSGSFAREGYAQGVLDQKISISFENKPIKVVLKEIERSSSVKFIYSSDLINSSRPISAEYKNTAVAKVLDGILSHLSLDYAVSGNQIVIKRAKSPNEKNEKASSSVHIIKGKVLDENGEGFVGVTVRVKDTSNGTATDTGGNFEIEANIGDVLVFSFVGYQNQEITVGNATLLEVTMKTDSQALEEVVVVGYGTARKKDLTGAVASVDIENTRNQPNTNASQMLRGTVAGVQIRDNGRPGQSGTIQIRGVNSISASSSPLIVLDGIIYSGGSLADINPNDIESIDILKDASSTAIYGSLATNGVIEITTKKGKSGKPKFSVNSYGGYSDYAYLPDYLTADEYLNARKDAEIAEGGAVPFSPTELENIAVGRSINPFDAIKQSAPMTNLELSASGRTDKVSYFLSGAQSTSKSPVRGDNFSRLSGRMNLGIQATNWLKIGLNSGYSSRDNSGVRASLSSTSYLSPFASLYLEDGVSPNPLPQDWGLVSNPLLGTLLDDNKSISTVFFSNAYADVNLWKGLSYKMNVGYTRNDSKDFYYSPSYQPLNRLGSGYKALGESQNLTLENIVKYKQRIDDKQSVDLTLLYGIYQLNNQNSKLSSQNIFNDALGYNSLEIGEGYAIDAGAAQTRQASGMARLGYALLDKYMLTLSVRRDGFSAFGTGRKYGVFPAAALAWNLSDEKFFSKIKDIDFLKVRVSWGRNGNRGISAYSSQSQMTLSNYVFGDGANTSIGLYTTTLANPNLGWETTESLNIGADLQAFKNRISLSANVYFSNTYDLLLNQTIPNTNGFETFLRNIGKVKNKGVEVDLKTVNIQKGDFAWNSHFAFSLNRNKVVQLTGRDINNDGIEDDDIASGWFIGYPLGSNFDYVFDGIFQEGDDLSLIAGAQPGDIKFKDVSGPNGTPDGVITPLDRQVVSNSQPKFLLGITNIFNYKNFSLSTNVNIREGGYSPNPLVNPGSNFFDQANFLNVPYWTASNPINTAPRINYRNPLNYGFYQSRSFVRLQDVSLAYNFPQKWMSSLKISNLQIYVSGKNLHTWTKWQGWDPEFGGGGRSPGNSGPLLKTYIAGINLSL
ncbi:TonB-dependent receptor [Marinilongibacter aquaticus]|uniref:TonB-dependent receptor n=1 Tax=Marinilongibacter aquaticus TaxID=2975157 RepID=UPI0021BD88C1|nr:TonB-dependent receptor [Marinilongibacter aquaticus]UBM59190.1 TonB-dependent receptor [Marinilongibacter aquaticus]